MRCVLKRNRSWGFNAFQYSVCDESKEKLDEKTKFRMHLRNRFFFFEFGPGEVSARHTDFHSILVLLGGIFPSEQDARYQIKFFYCLSNTLIFGFLTRFPLKSYHWHDWLPMITQRP